MAKALGSSAVAEIAVSGVGICGICAAGCGVNVHFADGKIDRLTPLRDHPLGIVCPRGMRASQIVYSPDPESRYRFRKPGFENPTSKFEIASEWLRAYGYTPLPVYTEPREGPLAARKVARKGLLVSKSGARTRTVFRSQHFNVPSLIAQQPLPMMHLHPEGAAIRNIKDDDPILHGRQAIH